MTAPATAPAPEAGTEAVATTGPPVLFLVLGALSVLTSIGLLFVGTLTANVLGYLLASVLPVLCVGLYRMIDLRRRLVGGYRPRVGLTRFVPIILVAGLAVAVIHVWPIATELAS